MSSDPDDARSQSVSRYEIVSLAERPELLDAHQTFGGAAWPEFMLHDPVAIAHWDRMMRHFSTYQLSLLSGDEIIAVINAVPLRFDGCPDTLPDRGVDWGVEKSVEDHQAGRIPNALMGLQIVVGKAFRRRGLSKASAQEMIRLAVDHGLESVLLPVRPSDKHRFPLIPMESYITWSNDKGLPYDSWLRVHLRLGGQLVKVCTESMKICGSIDKWSEWTGLEFPGSGEYIIPYALNPIEIDVKDNTGTYVEPNVWVVHQTA